MRGFWFVVPMVTLLVFSTLCYAQTQAQQSTIPFVEEFPDPALNPSNWPGFEGTPEIVTIDGTPSAPNALFISAEGSEETLTSRVFDLSGLSDVVLACFGSQLDLEAPEGVAIEYVADDGSWQVLHQFLGSNEITPFEFISFPLPNDAYHSAFRFRFRALGMPYTTPGFEGWYFDSIYLGVPSATPSMTVNPLTFSDTLFVNEKREHQVYISNANLFTSTLNYTIHVDHSATWLRVDRSGGQVGTMSQDILGMTIDGTDLAIGSYAGYVEVVGDDPGNPQDSVLISLEIIGAPVAVITPQFDNPVVVNEGDSAEVQITIANTGLSDLNWNVVTQAEPLKIQTANERENVSRMTAAAGDFLNPAVLKSAPFEALQLKFPLSGAGYSGAEFDGRAFYVTEYINGSVEKYDRDGHLLKTFTIPGTDGLRQIDFDGTFMYGVGSGNLIYEMNFDSETLISSIATPLNTLRSIAYDPDSDAFWISGYDTDILLLDRSGNTLFTIPSKSHGLTNIYGSVYDNRSDGGPYLWVVDRSIGSGADIIQFHLAAGALTGVSHDVLTDFPGLNAGGAGLFISEGIVPGSVSIGGALRSNTGFLYAYELVPSWINFLSPTDGMVQPGNQVDVSVRVYGDPGGMDTTYFVFNTNDPVNKTVQISLVRSTGPVSVEEKERLPMTFELLQNYPNPFNPSTAIKYSLPSSSQVELRIYNQLGQEIRTLVNTGKSAGNHQVIWDGRDDRGHSVSSGLYFYRLKAGSFVETRKMLLIR